jgi:hypothetical protein
MGMVAVMVGSTLQGDREYLPIATPQGGNEGIIGMVGTAVAEAAVAALSRGMTGHLHSTESVDTLQALRDAIERRLTGDRRAEHTFAAVMRDPRDQKLREALASELSYYTEVDPDFGSRLDRVVGDISRGGGQAAVEQKSVKRS